MMKFTAFSLMLILSFLSSCGSSDISSSGNAASRASMRDISKGLGDGEFEVALSGFIETTGTYQGDRPPSIFRANSIRSSRERKDGTGGRTAVMASNAEGPYRVSLRTQLKRGDGDPENGLFWIQLPAGAKAGQTYNLRDSLRSKDGEAYAGIIGDGHGWTQSRGLEGKVHVAELGETISLYVDFHNNRPEDSGHRIEGTVRANKLPFDERAEGTYTIKGSNIDESRTFGITSQSQIRNNRLTVLVGTGLYFEFHGAEPPVGTYQIGRRRSESVVSTSLSDLTYESLDGTLELAKDNGIYSAKFSFTTQGEDEVRVDGSFYNLKFTPR
jgi:hypothetical protein